MTTTNEAAEARRGPNPVDPKRLANSKWTAVTPVDREKHFLVVDVIEDATGLPTGVVLEAVLTKTRRSLPWQDLRDAGVWRIGWLD